MIDALEMEPVNAQLLKRRAAQRALGPYSALSLDFVAGALQGFFRDAIPGAAVRQVRRMGGGASKEQFAFALVAPGGAARECVLRMDPRGAVTESDRRRERDVLKAMQGVVPVPDPLWLDETGEYFGEPALIMNLVPGVAKPSGAGVKVSGLGTWLGEPLRKALAPQFMDCLVRIHNFDWRSASLPSFTAPDRDPQDAARWSLNFWRGLWALDGSEQRPIVVLAEEWLCHKLPACASPALTHGDYRTGNYLFDEQTQRITAILDWEMARIGDVHEDLAWVLLEAFGVREGAVFRASDLFEREEFIETYERASGRRVDRRTLHYYEVMAAWKCYIVGAANALAVARSAHNHQDVLLTFLASTSAIFAGELCRLLATEI